MSKAVAAEQLLRAGLAPRGLSREEAARYVGIAAGTFDQMVECGLMPTPKMMRGRRVWDRHAVDAAFERLPDAGGEVAGNDDDVWSRPAV